MDKKKVIIMGAAGRDFHNFNVYYKDNPRYEVVAFTAAQIPNIDDRKYPVELAGSLYLEGIPIYPQEKLQTLIKELSVDECVFSYSDIKYEEVMGISAIVNSAGADFKLLGPNSTMLKSNKPVISVCATRTGCGKSQTSRKVIKILMEEGLKVVVIRHPMPYGDLATQKVQRFATIEDLKKYSCTIEEMEEYEPHVERGNVIYAGVDYKAMLEAAEEDPDGCDIIIWDGGNNDFSFYKPDLAITILDPHRVGDELSYYPGEVSLRTADVAIINKVDSADRATILQVQENIKHVNPKATIIWAESQITIDNMDVIKGKSVLVIEDGPTLTHGGMDKGAGTIAAERFGAKEIVDPRQYAVGELVEILDKYKRIGKLLPAMGYSKKQLKDLEESIDKTKCDSVIIGTPIDLNRIINIKKPSTRVKYELEEIGSPNLAEILKVFINNYNLKSS